MCLEFTDPKLKSLAAVFCYSSLSSWNSVKLSTKHWKHSYPSSGSTHRKTKAPRFSRPTTSGCLRVEIWAAQSLSSPRSQYRISYILWTARFIPQKWAMQKKRRQNLFIRHHLQCTIDNIFHITEASFFKQQLFQITYYLLDVAVLFNTKSQVIPIPAPNAIHTKYYKQLRFDRVYLHALNYLYSKIQQILTPIKHC